MDEKAVNKEIMSVNKSAQTSSTTDVVLEKGIFSNIFQKDIRRAYLYKKAERIGKALHLLLPAFRDSKTLRDRAEQVAVGLIDASVLPPFEAKDAIARELLTLSSVIQMAQAGGKISPMNADIMLKEVRELLEEATSYEDPKVILPEVPTLASISKTFLRTRYRPQGYMTHKPGKIVLNVRNDVKNGNGHNGRNGTNGKKNGRREAIVSILSNKGSVYIKDLSNMIQEVSEKTIQRELQALVLEGKVKREGERRWTRYTLIQQAR